MNENFLTPIKDLFGNLRWFKPHATESRPLSERAALIRFFEQQNFTHKDGTKLTARELGVRLAHYNLYELYGLKSSYSDRLTRNGKEAARKYWWYITETV